jgi:signal transduction histidine kinase
VAVDRTSGERRVFDLREYFEETVANLKPNLKRSPHKVSIQCPPGILVDSYPGPLGQVLTNLIMNGLQHAYGEGDTGEILIDVQVDQDDMLEIRCSDNGVGIPANVIQNVFEPFFTTKRGKGGSGLGLHVVYNIVTANLHGTIKVESVEGKGTTFLLRMPRKFGASSHLMDGVPQRV